MDNKIWNEEIVIAAFEEAIRTLRKLPSARLKSYFTSWPEIIHSEIEILRMDQKPNKWPATAEDISKMEKVCSWIFFVKTVEERKIIWLRAARAPWKLICGQFGISRATANRKWKNAIRQITLQLD